MNELDRRALLWLQRHRASPLTRILVPLTHTARGRAWWSAAAVLIFLQLAGVTLPFDFPRSFFAPLLAWAICTPLKIWIGRPRPLQGCPGATPVIQAPTCNSFPSTHAASSVAFFTFFLLTGHPWAPWLGAWSGMVSFSRVYLGVHYPSDVGMGFMLGIGSGWLIEALTSL